MMGHEKPTSQEIDRAVRQAARQPLPAGSKQARTLATARMACKALGLCERCAGHAITAHVLACMTKRQQPTARGAVASAVEANGHCPGHQATPAPAPSTTPSDEEIGAALSAAHDRVRVVEAGSDGWMVAARGERGQLRFAVVRPTLQQANAIADCHRAIAAAGLLHLCPTCSERSIREQANGNSRTRLLAAVTDGCRCSPAAREARAEAERATARTPATFAARVLELQDGTGGTIATFTLDNSDQAEPMIFRAVRQALPDDCDAARAIDQVLPHDPTTGTSAALRALLFTSTTTEYLAQWDPQALKQALLALLNESEPSNGWMEALATLGRWAPNIAADVERVLMQHANGDHS
jgi:hypothetical protein